MQIQEGMVLVVVVFFQLILSWPYSARWKACIIPPGSQEKVGALASDLGRCLKTQDVTLMP